MQQQQGTKERRTLSKRPLKKLEGKTFYLDNLKKHQITPLCKAIHALGGRVESFLHKDVSFVVTESKEGLKQDKPVAAKEGTKGKSEEEKPVKQHESCLSREKQRPGTPRLAACGSRGKALLEKAIRNNERLRGSSVLSNARSWGVRIWSVESAFLYLKKLTKESCIAEQHSPVAKASTLNTPYLKIEDFDRKYKPLFTIYATFPGLCSLSRCSLLGSPPPPPPPPWFEQWAEQVEPKTREKKVKSVPQEKSPTPRSLPWLICKKDTSYCECCRKTFTSLKEHLQSDLHRSFAIDPSNYSMLDEVGAEMFDPDLFQPYDKTPNRPPTPSPVEEVCEMELQADTEAEPADHSQPGQDPPSNFLSASRSHLYCTSPKVDFTAPNPARVPSDTQTFSPETNCEFPDQQSGMLSPTIPVLHVKARAQDLLPQQPETQLLPPCPLSDPYSLPPVLSPQVPCPPNIMEPHIACWEPPVLSPQQYAADETVVGQPCERNFADIASRLISPATVSPSSPPLISEIVTDTEEMCQEASSGLICSNGGLESTTPSLNGSLPLPRLSAAALQPRKRRRSAGSEHGNRSHKRTNTCGDSSSWTGIILQPTKQQSDIMAEAEDDNQAAPVPNGFFPPGQSTVDMHGSYLSYLPALDFTCVPNQMDSFAYQPSSKAVTIDPALDLTTSRSHHSLNNQDSQRPQSSSTSVCIEPTLIPNPVTVTLSSSDSEWDCGLLSRLGPTPGASVTPTAESHELAQELLQELLHRPCAWTYDTSYESHLHNILQQSTTAATPHRDEKGISSISRSVAQIAEVQ